MARLASPASVLARFAAPTRVWLEESFATPTEAQRRAWPAIVEGKSTLLLAPTGSGKTLAAFLAAIDRLAFSPPPDEKRARCRVLYVSPLKALAVDIEKNLRAPLAGIARTAERLGVPVREPTVALRTGDTPASERARLSRTPADILITTPESLFLLLTSEAKETLRSVETVIVDEIHALVPQKRGSHLFLSLERLERLRPPDAPPLQRIGLSATQKDEAAVARLLGGGAVPPPADGGAARWLPRPVVVADARAPKPMSITIEVPVEDLAALGASERPGALRGDARQGRGTTSIWPSIHPRLVELVRTHRSTMIFVNSRRLAERLAEALNDTAGAEIARAHHGSVAREERAVIEERLKDGSLPCIVATSTLELGLDLGAVDLVVLVEAPPSVASGLQRVGRAGHHVGGTSEGVLVPKHRADLLACAAVARRMTRGELEETTYPKSPLDVLAQQIVAIVAAEKDIGVEALFDLVRSAAPYAELPRSAFDATLDMLSGRFPSDDFAELRPRVTWDRALDTLAPRRGAQRLAVVNAGTIPDRGLYGVFLDPGAGGEGKASRRIGELDEEMVFEAREGEVFVLGASSWRITRITHDRVLVLPAPGEPGKMPFWHGDRALRSAELGRGIGALVRKIAAARDDAAIAEALMQEHALDARAARNLVRYVRDEEEATGEPPTDRVLPIQRFTDEIGDVRVCLLSAAGGRVHAPLATAITLHARERLGIECDAVWSDDGIVLRFPESDEPPDVVALLPKADDVEALLVRSLGETAIFASRFREAAGRALLLPRRHPGRRSPLWAQRRRAADLLAVAARYGSFPILLETYREVLQDVFDLPALRALLGDLESGRVRAVHVDTERPSPFASSLLFSYVANFMYEPDAPLAERRAAALSIDSALLRELLGEVDLSELLDAEAIDATERALQRLEPPARLDHPDAVHDLLLSLGDLAPFELSARARPEDRAGLPDLLRGLEHERRVVRAKVGSVERLFAVEDAGRYRDAAGALPPPGLPAAHLEPVAAPLVDLASRWARTHGPFLAADLGRRWGVAAEAIARALLALEARGRLVRGAFRPGGAHEDELCDVEVLRAIKRRSLARLRSEIEPVSVETYACALRALHELDRPRRGERALLSAVERLEGCPLPADALERDVLPARVLGYRAGDLDALTSAGLVRWRGRGAGTVALYLAEHEALLAPDAAPAEGELEARVREALVRRGAVFFAELVRELGAASRDVLAALHAMAWAGEVTNDTLAWLRSSPATAREARAAAAPRGRTPSRPLVPPGGQGRWSLVARTAPAPSVTERRAALARTLLDRYGVLVREAAAAEGIEGGFASVYPVLRAMEDAGKARRGWFVFGLGATQFALPGADDALRAHRTSPDAEPEAWLLGATDPAQPYGALAPWPAGPEGTARPQRARGAHVILLGGRLIAWLGRTERSLLTFLPEGDPDRTRATGAVARELRALVESGRRRAVVLRTIDGAPAQASPLAPALVAVGFARTLGGLMLRRSAASYLAVAPAASGAPDPAAPEAPPLEADTGSARDDDDDADEA